MSLWSWYRPYEHRQHRAAFSNLTGESFLYDGNSLFLLDMDGDGKEVDKTENHIPPDNETPIGVPYYINISPTGLHMTCAFQNRMDTSYSVVAVYGRWGKLAGESRVQGRVREALFTDEGDIIVDSDIEASPVLQSNIFPRAGNLELSSGANSRLRHRGSDFPVRRPGHESPGRALLDVAVRPHG